jgi:hypothetical protein
LVFALPCSVNCKTLYRQVCTFPNHVQSIEFTTGGVQSSSRSISRKINGNRMHLSSISSLTAKGLNTYVNKVFMFFLFYTFGKYSINLFSLCHYAVLSLCVDWFSFFFSHQFYNEAVT